MSWLPSLLAELPITLTDPVVWLSIGEGLLFGGVCLLLGIWVARTVGMLQSGAPAGEILGVGLASGLMVLAAWWAAIRSGGRSSFTPVAVAFAMVLALAVVGRAHRPSVERASGEKAMVPEPVPTRRDRRHSSLLTAVAAAVFVVAVALLYGATAAPSPRDGVQPVEQLDQVFYAVLGRDLATTGTETTALPSGFPNPPGLPVQTWYHWGELWLAAGVITLFGATPMHARYLVVLPVLLLAAAALTGTLVRRMGRTSSRRAYLFGVLVCLFLSPIPLLPGPFYSSWATGLIVEINSFGLASVAVLLALYDVAVLGTRSPTWALAGFVGSAAALILPAHIVIALLGLVGVASVWALRLGRAVLIKGELPGMSLMWRRTLAATGAVLLATIAWGVVTGHGLGGGALLPNVTPFNPTWRATVAIVVLGAGVFFAVPIAWVLVRNDRPALAEVYLATMVIFLAGTFAWGWRTAEFDMFYFFFGAIAVFAEPMAAIALWTLPQLLRKTRHLRLAAAVALLTIIQLDLAIVFSGLRLEVAGSRDDAPIPVSLLDAIKRLPADSELAYACQPFEEVSYGNPKLISIDAHTDRRVVPMCFAADIYSTLVGAKPSAQVPNVDMALAPQHVLYPTASAHPSSAVVAAFLKTHGIDYIFADAMHPNTLVADAVPVAS